MTVFFQINVFWPFLLQIHSSHSPYNGFKTKHDRKLQYFTVPIRPILYLIIEKIETSLNNANFFSNKRFLAIYFIDSQFT